jgi:hypothetical protein
MNTGDSIQIQATQGNWNSQNRTPRRNESYGRISGI